MDLKVTDCREQLETGSCEGGKAGQNDQPTWIAAKLSVFARGEHGYLWRRGAAPLPSCAHTSQSISFLYEDLDGRLGCGFETRGRFEISPVPNWSKVFPVLSSNGPEDMRNSPTMYESITEKNTCGKLLSAADWAEARVGNA